MSQAKTFKILTYFDQQIPVTFIYSQCTITGEVIELNREMTVRFELEDSSTSSLISALNLTKSLTQSQLVYTIPKYSLTPPLVYDFLIKAELTSDANIFVEQIMSILVVKSDLLVEILGSNRQNGYESPLVV